MNRWSIMVSVLKRGATLLYSRLQSQCNAMSVAATGSPRPTYCSHPNEEELKLQQTRPSAQMRRSPLWPRQSSSAQRKECGLCPCIVLYTEARCRAAAPKPWNHWLEWLSRRAGRREVISVHVAKIVQKHRVPAATPAPLVPHRNRSARASRSRKLAVAALSAARDEWVLTVFLEAIEATEEVAQALA